MPQVVEVPANIVVVWPLSVLYFKETGRKDDGDGFVVKSSSFCCNIIVLDPCICIYDVSKKGTESYFYLDQLARLSFCVFHMLHEICKYIRLFWCCILWLGSSSVSVPDFFWERTKFGPHWFHVRHVPRILVTSVRQ